MTASDIPPTLNALEKVVTLVGLMSGVTPSWVEREDDLSKLVCALTGMKESEAEAAIDQAVEQGLIKYFGAG
ncbi:MAG: hypothetical protein HYR90_02870 [Candidatus Andersenbacteria bacterium]|nr:hypothetical protein [Candidatus Andersenbacteria bacterium]MBI3251100.1 hypothetical protein [Candidatus Andersenbacteria bacterium]